MLRDDEYFTDVTLATEGHSVKAHRVILSACSNYFHAILKTMRPWQHPVLVLQDVKSADLNSLMDFIYFGQVGNLKRIILFERAERFRGRIFLIFCCCPRSGGGGGRRNIRKIC